MSELSPLADKQCIACQGGEAALAPDEREALLRQIPDWEIIYGHHLSRDYQFNDFSEALDFANRAGAIAEEEGHHPEITIGWAHARVDVWTHKIDALTESDFVLAAKFDRMFGTLSDDEENQDEESED